MPKRKGGPAPTDKADPEQYARFVAKARELECDDDPARFDAMVRRIVGATSGKRRAEAQSVVDEQRKISRRQVGRRHARIRNGRE